MRRVADVLRFVAARVEGHLGGVPSPCACWWRIGQPREPATPEGCVEVANTFDRAVIGLRLNRWRVGCQTTYLSRPPGGTQPCERATGRGDIPSKPNLVMSQGTRWREGQSKRQTSAPGADGPGRVGHVRRSRVDVVAPPRPRSASPRPRATSGRRGDGRALEGRADGADDVRREERGAVDVRSAVVSTPLCAWQTPISEHAHTSANTSGCARASSGADCTRGHTPHTTL